MTTTPGLVAEHGLEIQSTLSADGGLRLELAEVPIAQPGDDEVLVAIEAAPINPSDLMTMFASADPASVRSAGSRERPVAMLQVSPEKAAGYADRFGKPFIIGLEGAGRVVAAGKNAESLLGRTVAALTLGRGMFAQYRTLPAAACVPLPEGTTAAEGGDVFVNPLTALTIVENMRLDGFSGLIHTAAASNLGQMLVKICAADGIPLVNIVRREEQVDLLRGIGATHICNSSVSTFRDDLVRAIAETGAMVAFDALGGGLIADQLLKAMEEVAASKLPEYSPYGTMERKHVHVYGHLDSSPMQLTHPGYGSVWGVSGWIMTDVLARVGAERAMELQQRIVRELKTTFASHYAREISLAEALDPEVMAAYTRRATGEKYLINPTL